MKCKALRSQSKALLVLVISCVWENEKNIQLPFQLIFSLKYHINTLTDQMRRNSSSPLFFNLHNNIWRTSCTRNVVQLAAAAWEQPCSSWISQRQGRCRCTAPSLFLNHPLEPGWCCEAALSPWRNKDQWDQDKIHILETSKSENSKTSNQTSVSWIKGQWLHSFTTQY